MTVVGGTSPYAYTPYPSPPNPPGVVLHPGPPVLVTVPEDTPSGTVVRVQVTDSSDPPESAVASSVVA